MVAPMSIATNKIWQFPLALLVALCAFTSPAAFPAELEDAKQGASATQFTIRSEILKEGRVVLVYLPDTYASEPARQKRYPVLYLLDGRAYFEVTTGIAHHLGSWNAAVQWIPDLIVVAIQNTNKVTGHDPDAYDRRSLLERKRWRRGISEVPGERADAGGRQAIPHF
jgi:enterochelin esterase-like enzyme